MTTMISKIKRKIGWKNMKRIFVLDTNVLLHDSESIRSFGNNTVVIPSSVLDELDNHKTGTTEKSANCRRVIRILDELRGKGRLIDGVKLNSTTIKVVFDHDVQNHINFDLNKIDHKIINLAKHLMETQNEQVTLVSKDINMRVKADLYDLNIEDYNKDKIKANVSDLYTGFRIVNIDSQTINAMYTPGKIITPADLSFDELPHMNECLLLQNDDGINKSSILTTYKGHDVEMDSITSYSYKRSDAHGIHAKNKEQNFALNMLMDPEISLVTLTGKAGCGKAQPLHSKVLTPSGWTTMGEIKKGDKVISVDGKPTKVLDVYPQGKKDTYRVFFRDGSSTECCGEHLWYTRTQTDRDRKREGSVKDLREIMKTLRHGTMSKRNHSVPMVSPVEFDGVELDLDPYIMGCLLGDGSLLAQIKLSTADDEVLDSCRYERIGCHLVRSNSRKYDHDIRSEKKPNPIKEILIKYDVINKRSWEKSIPEEYKITSVENRIAILQGLCDTDGTVLQNGYTISYTSTSKQLAEDVAFLVMSLGGKAVIRDGITTYTYKGSKKNGRVSYRIYISMPPEICPFRLTRKKARYVPRTKYTPTRYIDRIEHVGNIESQCILVDHPTHLYVTDDFIVTHNTLLACAAALQQENDKLYNKIIISRPTEPSSRDLGFLPGTIQEKLMPWMAPLYDNLEICFGGDKRMIDDYVGYGRIELEAITYIRGRSIPNAFIIVDEAQQLTQREIKLILTRVSTGSKVVLTGDIEQIDNPYLDATSNGLAYAIEKFKDQRIAAHITMIKGVRSELATISSEIL